MELRPIRTEKDYLEALREIELLFDAAPNTPESERLDVLSILVEAYEKTHFPIQIPDPIEAIQFHGVTTIPNSDQDKLFSFRPLMRKMAC